jgi:hypothetical protein
VISFETSSAIFLSPLFPHVSTIILHSYGSEKLREFPRDSRVTMNSLSAARNKCPQYFFPDRISCIMLRWVTGFCNTNLPNLSAVACFLPSLSWNMHAICSGQTVTIGSMWFVSAWVPIIRNRVASHGDHVMFWEIQRQPMKRQPGATSLQTWIIIYWSQRTNLDSQRSN